MPPASPVTPCCPACGSPAPFPPGPPPPPPAPRAAWDAERKARLAAWVTANCGRRGVKVAEIAAEAGVSVRRLEAAVRRDFGCTPMQLLRRTGLHQAHLALTGHGPAPESIAAAAATAGFSRVARFNAAYRQRYGRQPAIYPRGGAVTPGPAPGHGSAAGPG